MVYVLVPSDVPPNEISAFVDKRLAQHRRDVDGSISHGRFDYLVGSLSEQPLDDAVTLGPLPPREKRALAGRMCEISRLPAERVPGAVVTPDGIWHDLRDQGWRFMTEETTENREAFVRWTAQYQNLIAAHPWHLVVEAWAHS